MAEPMNVGKFDFGLLINHVSDDFESNRGIEVTNDARQELFEPTKQHEREMREDLATGKITPEFLAEALHEVLSTAASIAQNRGHKSIHADDIKESTRRKCPYVPWC